jgi:hypothetical protein
VARPAEHQVYRLGQGHVSGPALTSHQSRVTRSVVNVKAESKNPRQMDTRGAAPVGRVETDHVIPCRSP